MAEPAAARARLRIVSRMTSPDGDVQETKNARVGTCLQDENGIALEYDDVQEGERAHIVLTAKDGRAEMRRKGMTNAVLTFVPGERRASRYVTVYGDIPVAVDTRSVTLSRREEGGTLMLDYDVYVAGEKTAATALTVEWRL